MVLGLLPISPSYPGSLLLPCPTSRMDLGSARSILRPCSTGLQHRDLARRSPGRPWLAAAVSSYSPLAVWRTWPAGSTAKGTAQEPAPPARLPAVAVVPTKQKPSAPARRPAGRPPFAHPSH